MKKIFYLYSKSLLSKLALVAILVIGGGNFAWAQKDLPYSYGFENDLATEGWTIVNGNSSMTAINDGFKKTGTYSFRFYYNSSNTPQYLISPELETSSNEIEVSFYYYDNKGSKDKVKFKVGSTTKESPEVGDFSWDTEITTPYDYDWHPYSHTFPAGTKHIAIQFTGTDYRLYIDDISIDISETYKRPKNLTLESFSSTTATLSWTNGSSENAWEIAYSTNEDFTPSIEGNKVSVTENPYTLSGLTDGATYYAYVRSNYDGNYSEWSNKVELMPMIESTPNSNTNTSIYAPIHNNTNYGTDSQFVIPSDNTELTNLRNRLITRITFYGYGSKNTDTNVSWTNATFDIYMNEVETTTYTSTSVTLKDWGTKVASSKTLSLVDGEMVIDLDTPFEYTTGNLLIGLRQDAKTSSSVSSTWYGTTESTNYTSAYTYKYSENGAQYTGSAKFSPKVKISTVSSTLPATIGLNGYTTFASPRALDLASLPSGLKAYKASTIDGTRVRFTEIDDVVAANTGILLEGTASETYNIPVATTSGNDISDSNLFFVNSTGGTFTAESGYTYYGMIKATSAADPIVFGTFAPGSVAIPTNRAYLKVANSGGTSRLTCVFDNGGTTGVQTVNAEPLTVNQYFDLQGRRVAQPTRGLYIINGKKVVIK